MRPLIFAFLLTIAISAIAQTLDDDAILKMVKSGVGDDLIVSMIQHEPGRYSLTPNDLARLKQGGVSEKVLTAMANKVASGSDVASGTVKVPLKTPVRLAVYEAISSKTARAGDTFKLVVAESVVLDGHVAIAKDSPATGRIITADKKSFATHNGKLEVAVDSVRAVDGQDVAVDGRLTIGGGGVGFGRTGSEAQIDKGQVISAVVASGTEVKY
jgi:hypothetical protein